MNFKSCFLEKLTVAHLIFTDIAMNILEKRKLRELSQCRDALCHKHPRCYCLI